MQTTNPVVHLELHTGNLRRAVAFYQELLGWRTDEVVTGAGTYRSLGLAAGLGGGVVECGVGRAMWLPYAAVEDISAATDRARKLGADVPLEPREGPAGWRSVVAGPGGAGLALWQPKPRR
jgi:predicted enzyme related to lactoylglutathione lyase